METKEQKQYYITVKGQKVPVSEEVYRAYVRPVEASEREERRNSKCLVKGERSGLVRCKEDCSKCPYYMAGNKLLGGKLSLDGLIDQGYEESSGEDIESEVIERQEKNKRTEALHKAIARLTKQQKKVIEEIFFNEKTQCVLAEELGVSQQAVSRVLKQAISKLKKFLENF